jgi:hypothetical protein
LSPLLFLLVAEGLNRAISHAKSAGTFSGIKISPVLFLTHLLFVDDVLIFSGGSRREVEVLRNILSLFSKATGMQINDRKSSLSTYLLTEEEEQAHNLFFPYERKTLDDGIKYLGFILKPNDYRKEDWKWLLKKMDKRLNTWSHRWLSRAGRLVLVKSVLEAILVYWMSLSWIPKGILEAARKLTSKFLWSGKKEAHVIPWVRWDKIVVPKAMGGWGLKNIFLFSKALVAKGGWRIINSSSLWTKVIIQKYIEPVPLEFWIRSQQKSKKGASVIWKAILNAFPLIENGLAWKLGNGHRFRLGKDPWPGSEGKHILSEQLIQHLHSLGFTHLNTLADPNRSTLWSQGWTDPNRLGLSEEEKLELESYIYSLKSSQIRLTDNEDELIWDPTPSGIYSPKLGYLKYNSDLGLREPVWWWRKLWKVKSLTKTRLFMWNVLQNKVPTWDNLQKRNFVGPGWCSLCKSEGENLLHLFLKCIFINKVWKETSRLLNLHCVWEGRDLDHSWFTWWKTRAFKHLRALPLLVIWGVWLAQNSFIFKGTPPSPEITVARSVALLPSFLSQSPRLSTRQPQEVVIDSSSPWGFFDGASQQNICGGGGLLYLSASHYFIMTFGFGPGTNNFAELLSLKLLIAFAIEKGCCL